MARLTRALICIVLAIVIWIGGDVWLRRGERVAAQGSTITLRPSAHDPSSTLGNPANAYDNSNATSAGSAITRICSQHCTTPSSATATYSGVPDGYHPLQLEVQWRANASAAMFGNDTFVVTATVEYSLNGGSAWSTLETYSWTSSSAACTGKQEITCADHVATLPLSDYQSTGAIQVRATLSVQLTHCDNCTIRVSNASGQIAIYDIRVIADNCEIPTGETTTATGWDGAGHQKFSQTLLRAAGAASFNGRTVTEEDPGGGGPDTCWFSGSAVAPFEAITGGSWTANSSEVWEFDYVGWGHSPVTYYRAQGRAPCSTEFPQRMVISCGAGTAPYVLNTLAAGIETTTEWAERAGVFASNTWP